MFISPICRKTNCQLSLVEKLRTIFPYPGNCTENRFPKFFVRCFFGFFRENHSSCIMKEDGPIIL